MKLLIGLLLLFPSLLFAQTPGTYTICDTCNHATLAAAETAHEQDLTASGNDSILTFEIKEGSSPWADQGTTSIDGSNTDATHFVTVVTTGNARHSGVWDGTNAYRLSATYRPLYINDDFVVIDGIQAEATGTFDSRFCIESQGSEVTIKNCIFRHENTSSSAGGGIYFQSTGISFAFNNIIYDTNAAPAGTGIRCLTDFGDARCYNNTIVNFASGINGGFTDAVAINNIIWGCVNPVGPEDVYGGSPYSHHNATDSSSFDYGAECGGNCGTGDITGMSDPFVDLANQNFLLANGSSDPAEDGSSESGVLTDDILGTSRPQSTNWDIGAHEFPADGEPPAALLPIIRTIIH